MKIKQLGIQNFLSISSVELYLDKYTGITLIEGINSDSSTSLNNGAGKSSIIESILYVFTGKTKRGYSGDEVVNNVAKKNCHVKVLFEVKGVEYVINRYRKDETLGNLVSILQVDGHDYINMTKGTAKETQKQIEDIIGLSELTLSKMLYFGQEDIRSFAGLTDAELKSVFEEAMGLGILSEHETIIKNEILSKKEELNSAKNKLNMLEMTRETETLLLENNKRSHEEFEKNKERDVAYFSEKILSLEKEIGEIDKVEDDLADSLKKKILDFDSKEEQIANLIKIKDSVEKTLNEKHEAASLSKHQLSSILTKISSLDNMIKNSLDSVGKNCPTCNRVFKEEDISGFVASSKKQLDESLLEKEEISRTYEDALNKFSAIKDKMPKIKDALDKILVFKTEAQEAELRLKELSRSSKKEPLEKHLADIKEKMSDLIKSKSVYADRIKDAEVNLGSVVLDIEKQSLLVASLNNLIDDLQLLQSCFSNTGIKNRIFDNITPELNRIISEYMNYLDEIDVEITTMKKLKTGGVREKFEILVSNRNGASDYKGNSGGEKQKIDLCISLAFNALMRKTVTSPLNILFLDEPFESLDQGSSEAAISLCSEIAKNTNVFIITHNPAIKDLVTNRIVIEKKAGQSTLVM